MLMTKGSAVYYCGYFATLHSELLDAAHLKPW